jgi:hypothetical protein
VIEDDDTTDAMAPALKLLVDHVDTVEKLEVIAAVLDGVRDAWSLDTISTTIRISPTQLRPHLDELRACGLLRSIPGRSYRFRYDPQTPILAQGARALHAAYQQDRGSLIKIIRLLETERARRSPADVFAEAFVVRRRTVEDTDE